MDNNSNNREDLIVDILEKVSDKVDNISLQLVRQGVILEVNTEELSEHKRRTLASEDRLELLEKDAQFVRNILKIVAVGAAFLTFVAEVVLPLLRR